MRQKWLFETADVALREMLIAELSVLGFDSFDEDENCLNAYASLADIEPGDVEETAQRYGVVFRTEELEEKNWNALWEEQFEPVVVTGFCTVRADFHRLQPDTPYEIVITPKMSFGTGHHATTRLMIGAMCDLDFKDKTVFDFGTGTGILAVLAELLGAREVLAIDNDIWSYENALENAARNNSRKITVSKGSLELAEGQRYDIILANINRHILLHYMAGLYGLLQPGGSILMSGLLEDDFGIVHQAAAEAGFTLSGKEQEEKWILLRLEKAL